MCVGLPLVYSIHIGFEASYRNTIPPSWQIRYNIPCRGSRCPLRSVAEPRQKRENGLIPHGIYRGVAGLVDTYFRDEGNSACSPCAKFVSNDGRRILQTQAAGRCNIALRGRIGDVRLHRHRPDHLYRPAGAGVDLVLQNATEQV